MKRVLLLQMEKLTMSKIDDRIQELESRDTLTEEEARELKQFRRLRDRLDRKAQGQTSPRPSAAANRRLERALQGRRGGTR